MGKPLPKPKKRSVSKLKKELGGLFSKFIRYRDQCQCYTCPKKDDPKRMQNGHFVPRQYLSVRFDEVTATASVTPATCNGEPPAYAARLERDFGKGTVEMLECRRSEVTKDFPYEYRIGVCKEKVQSLGQVT